MSCGLTYNNYDEEQEMERLHRNTLLPPSPTLTGSPIYTQYSPTQQNLRQETNDTSTSPMKVTPFTQIYRELETSKQLSNTSEKKTQLPLATWDTEDHGEKFSPWRLIKTTSATLSENIIQGIGCSLTTESEGLRITTTVKPFWPGQLQISNSIYRKP